MKLIHIFFYILSLAPAILFAEDKNYYKLYEYAGVLDVEIPYKKILGSERFQARLRVENRGSEAIRVTRKGFNTDTQLVWIPWKDGKLVRSSGLTLVDQSYKKSPVEAFSEISFDLGYGTIILKPGEVYEHQQMLVMLQRYHAFGSGAGFRPAFYGGKGKVIYGKPFKIEFARKAFSNSKKVFEIEKDKDGKPILAFEIYEVSIDGETYLFGDTGMRFCRIPPGVGYSISHKQTVNPKEYYTTVTFDDPTLEPHVYSWRHYQLVSASRATVPWLFDKPGEDKVVGPKTREGRVYKAPLKTPRSKPVKQLSETVKKKDTEENEPAYKLGLITVLILIAALLAVFLYARKKKRYNIEVQR